MIAAPIPLTSLGDDAAAVRRTIARTTGPVILAAHAYAGAVISAFIDERVKALVYISASLLTRAKRLRRSSTAITNIRSRLN